MLDLDWEEGEEAVKVDDVACGDMDDGVKPWTTVKVASWKEMLQIWPRQTLVKVIHLAQVAR